MLLDPKTEYCLVIAELSCILHTAHALEVLKSNTRERVSCMFKSKISVGVSTERKKRKKNKIK